MALVIEELDIDTLREVISLVHSATGISIPEHKKTMIKRRLSSRLRSHSITSFKEYLSLVKKDNNELVHFINMVTTNETNFFRTDRVWEYFEQIFLTDFLKHSAGKTLKMWSAASSTGEEGYSLAMSCEEFKQEHKCQLNYNVLGTDIASSVVSHAECGKYEGRNIDNLRKKNPYRLEKYFREKDGLYSISPSLKSNTSFKVHNLFKVLDEPGSFDIIFLRNVLIYFTPVDQEIVIQNIEKKLSPEGILVIGESESLSRLDTKLKFVSPLVYKKCS
ncbi:protein-glutamate O-methyltransferase CheR [Halobacteriovorax sp.]|uniref:CheR family methyltransferase n=1 Tax=Halobacteriovorax sp. TaxID=2020862 RepID=UPI003568F299